MNGTRPGNTENYAAGASRQCSTKGQAGIAARMTAGKGRGGKVTTKSLTGKKRIACYANRSWATVLKWIKDDHFPATKIDGIWESDKEMIDNWKKNKILKSCQ